MVTNRAARQGMDQSADAVDDNQPSHSNEASPFGRPPGR